MINYIIITAARCAPENRQTALSHMPGFAADLISKAGLSVPFRRDHVRPCSRCACVCADV